MSAVIAAAAREGRLGTQKLRLDVKFSDFNCESIIKEHIGRIMSMAVERNCVTRRSCAGYPLRLSTVVSAFEPSSHRPNLAVHVGRLRVTSSICERCSIQNSMLVQGRKKTLEPDEHVRTEG